METNQIRGVERPAANSHRCSSTNPSFPITTFVWLAASLLILLGIAFELGMLGFGPYNSSGVWMISVIGRNTWTMLADLAVPEIRELVRIWPLILVSLGSAILLIARGWHRFDSVAGNSSGRKENHAD